MTSLWYLCQYVMIAPSDRTRALCSTEWKKFVRAEACTKFCTKPPPPPPIGKLKIWNPPSLSLPHQGKWRLGYFGRFRILYHCKYQNPFPNPHQGKWRFGCFGRFRKFYHCKYQNLMHTRCRYEEGLWPGGHSLYLWLKVGIFINWPDVDLWVQLSITWHVLSRFGSTVFKEMYGRIVCTQEVSPVKYQSHQPRAK